MKRRQFVGLLAASASLAACSNNLGMKTLSTAFQASFGNSSSFEPGYPDQLPYASIAVSIKNLSRALLILGKVEGDEFHWLSADRSVLVTRHGRIVRTVGLSENIARSEFSGNDHFEDISNNERVNRASRIVDLTPGNRYGIKIESTLITVAQERITIGKHQYETTRFDENCVAPILAWKFTNSYWADKKGYVWRSTQHVGPNSQPMTIEVTKPYQA